MRRIGSLTFHDVDVDDILVYSHHAPAGSHLVGEGADADTVICVVNLDPTHVREATVHLDLGSIGLDGSAPYEVRDELDGTVYTWRGSSNYVLLDPAERPGHVLAVQRCCRPLTDGS